MTQLVIKKSTLLSMPLVLTTGGFFFVLLVTLGVYSAIWKQYRDDERFEDAQVLAGHIQSARYLGGGKGRANEYYLTYVVVRPSSELIGNARLATATYDQMRQAAVARGALFPAQISRDPKILDAPISGQGIPVKVQYLANDPPQFRLERA